MKLGRAARRHSRLMLSHSNTLADTLLEFLHKVDVVFCTTSYLKKKQFKMSDKIVHISCKVCDQKCDRKGDA